MSSEDAHFPSGVIGTMTPRPWLSAMIPVNQLPSRFLHENPSSLVGAKRAKSVYSPEDGFSFPRSAYYILNGKISAIRNPTKVCGLGTLSYQILCCIFGALQAFFAAWILLVFAVSLGRAHINPTANDRPVRPYNSTDLAFYGAYGLMWLNGILLITASGVCVRENRFACLAHFILATVDTLWLVTCFAFHLQHPSSTVSPDLKGISKNSNVVLGHILNSIPILIIVPAAYFSLGLFLALRKALRK